MIHITNDDDCRAISVFCDQQVWTLMGARWYVVDGMMHNIYTMQILCKW